MKNLSLLIRNHRILIFPVNIFTKFYINVKVNFIENTYDTHLT